MRRLASDGSAGNEYGWAVSVSANYAVAGAYNSASAYVLYKDQGGTDNWDQVKKLTPTGAGDAFGFSVAISGDYVVVGDIDAGYNYTGVLLFLNKKILPANQRGFYFAVEKIRVLFPGILKFSDHTARIIGRKNRIPHHKHIDSGINQLADIGKINTTINLDQGF